jgi:hypothetical protein
MKTKTRSKLMMKFIKTKQLELDSMVLQLHQRALETEK